MHDILQGLRKVADNYNAVLIGETWTSDVQELNRYYGPHGNELQMPMDFMFTKVDKLSPPEFRKQIAAVDGAAGWPVYVLRIMTSSAPTTAMATANTMTKSPK